VFASSELIARHAVIAVLGTAWSSTYHPEDEWYPRSDGHYPRGELGRIESTNRALADVFIGECVKRAEAAIADECVGECRQGYMRHAVRAALELLPDPAPCPVCGRPIHEPPCGLTHESLQAEATADAMKPPGGGS